MQNLDQLFTGVSQDLCNVLKVMIDNVIAHDTPVSLS